MEPGAEVIMTKGYKGVRGIIEEKTDSNYGFYIIKLENGIHLVAGAESFTPITDEEN